MIKLNIGAGFDIKPTDKGWVNIDGNPNDGVNHVMDLANDAFPYMDNSIDHILAQNIIEHISRHKQEEFVTKLYKMLKVGGTITIEMPNLNAIAEMYLGLRGEDKKLGTFGAAAFIFGAQEDDFGCHRWIYDMQELDELLCGIGFIPYYINEIRGTNLIYKAIKSDKGWVKDACIDVASASDKCFVLRQPNDSNADRIFMLFVVRLAQVGRVFIIGGDRHIEFEDENIINITNMLPGIDEPLYDHDVEPLVLQASCYIDENTSMRDFAIKADVPTLCLHDDQSGFIIDGIHAGIGYNVQGGQEGIAAVLDWIYNATAH